MAFLGDILSGLTGGAFGTKNPTVGVRGPGGEQLAEEQELLNRFNIRTPEGSRFFDTDEQGRSVLNIQENEFQQQQRARREALASSFLGSLSGGDDRFAQERDRISSAIFERGRSRLEPFLEKRRRQTQTQLAAQGLPVGSEARRDALAELGRDETDLLTALSQQSEIGGASRQQQLRNLSLQEAGAFGGEIGGIDKSFFGSNIGEIDRAGIIQESQALDLEAQGINLPGQQKRKDSRDSTIKNIAGTILGGFF